MSTNSSITVKVGDVYKSVYCHWDGYLAYNGKILLEHYNSQEKAESLIKLGNISSLGKSIECPKGHTFDTPVEGYSVFYGRDRGQKAITSDSYEIALREIFQDYNYLFEDGKWFLGRNRILLTDELIAGE